MATHDQPVSLQTRLGAGALGLLLGLAAGFLLAVVCAATGWMRHLGFAGWVFGAGAGVALGCFAYPGVAFVLLPAVGHLVAGTMAASATRDEYELLQPDRTIPTWLRAVFSIGAVAATALALVGLLL